MTPSRKANEFRISRPAIGPDTVRFEPVLHVRFPGVIELEAALLHDLENLGLTLVVKASACVTRLDIAAEVKGVTREACFDIAMEAVGQSCIDVIAAGEV